MLNGDPEGQPGNDPATAPLLHSCQNCSISIAAQKDSTWARIGRVVEAHARAPLTSEIATGLWLLLWAGHTITISPGLMEWADIPFLRRTLTRWAKAQGVWLVGSDDCKENSVY